MSAFLLSKAFWLSFGLFLMLLEIVVPGAILVFLGIGAVFVGLAIWAGWITTWPMALTAWFISSLILIIVLRSLISKFIGGDTERGEIDEDVQAYGELAMVIEDIEEGGIGRIQFRETTWSAKSSKGTIAAGSEVKIVSRDNINWIVEENKKLD